MSSPKPYAVVPGTHSGPFAPAPVTLEGLGALNSAEVADFVAVDASPADATAVASDLQDLVDSLIAAGIMAAS